jgi:carbon-monoxide dehydrogenase small subunit
MTRVLVTFTVNGGAAEVLAAPGDRLLDVLRGPLGLVGCREACGNGECGACTVLVDGKAMNACLVPALEIDGRSVTTIEGLVGAGGELSPLQRAFVAHGGIQCGFCTPGMILAAKALLDANPAPTEREIREALVGNLCRCTGYAQIVRAIQAAAAEGRRG